MGKSNITNNCWWSDEVLPPDNSPAVLFRDFVLISEFSELEGPLPLAVVSDSNYIDLKHFTDKQSANTNEYKLLEHDLNSLGLQSFDFNSFVLRVVSVDRSTELEQIDEEAPMTPSSLLEETPKPYLFSIPDDTQVYFTDSENNFFAFTHHLTLFDINARGYVHPVALSYITRDPNKILFRFEELMEKFNEVSVRLKKGNYSNFTLDLKCRLLDLEYTQSNLNISTQTYTPTCNKPALSIQAIQQAITATKLMIDTLESTSSQIHNMTSTNNSNNADGLKTVSSDTSISSSTMRYSVDPPKDYKPKYIDTLYPVAHFERKLRSLAQLCQEPDDEKEKHHIKRPSFTQKTATMIPLVFSMIESQSSQPPMSTSSSTATATPSSVASQRPTFANTIAHNMYTEAIKYIQEMTRYFGKSSVVLDVEEEDNLFVDPISSALTIGRTFMLNVDNPQPREHIPTSPTFKDETEKTSENYASQNSPTSELTNKKEDEKETLTTRDDDELYYPLLFSPSQLWKPDGTKMYLLEVLRRYQSLIVDVIFSLLTGRTVLIQGSADNKSLVQKVVRALSVFVPGQDRDKHQIIDWFEESRLTDIKIKSIKLVGIDKDNMDPSIHIDSSCVLDVDVKNGSLNSSPVYVEGQWINQFLDRIMLFSSDESYLAYLHTVFMSMSLKAFIYHHLYVNDEFKLDESPPSTFSGSNKGYTSETNSESSTISRKWSVRLMSYLKKHEDTTTEENSSVTESENGDYTDENQATITLQNVQENKPRTIVGMFEPPKDIPRRGSIAFSSRRGSASSSSDDESRATFDKSELNFGADDLMDFEDNSGDSSSDEETTRKAKHRYRDLSDIGPDGVSYIEREGRRYLQEKLKLYGDDQTIVVYLATCVLQNRQ